MIVELSKTIHKQNLLSGDIELFHKMPAGNGKVTSFHTRKFGCFELKRAASFKLPQNCMFPPGLFRNVGQRVLPRHRSSQPKLGFCIFLQEFVWGERAKTSNSSEKGGRNDGGARFCSAIFELRVSLPFSRMFMAGSGMRENGNQQTTAHIHMWFHGT